MPDYNIILPSKPKIILEKDFSGMYEIDSLYPGYGHTLGNSLRRIILSSMPGAAITSIKIEGVQHEFSTMEGVKEDVVMIILNLKKVNFKLSTNEPQEITFDGKGPQKITAGDFNTPGQVEILNPDQYITEVTSKNTSLNITARIEKGLGYVPKEVLQKDKVEIGTIAFDAVFTPIRRVNYEVENMRVGNRTDYNKLRIFIETDGTISPKEALEDAIYIMIQQFKAIVGFKEEQVIEEKKIEQEKEKDSSEDIEQELLGEVSQEDDKDVLKIRIDTLSFSSRPTNALAKANIRTLGGLARKSEEELLKLEGLGEKGVKEIKDVLARYEITLR